MAQIEFAMSEDGLLNYFDDVPEAVDRYESLIREVELAEEMGFKYHFTIEHQSTHFGQIQSPMVYFAALAQRTSTIRFAQMVLNTTFYHPMRFAMDTAMIDQLSRGRMEVGVGAGPLRFETDRWKLPFSDRRERFPEFMEIVKKAWTEERINYQGKIWQLDNAISLPRPYQKPHPPIWYGGRSKWSLEWAVANHANLGAFLRTDQEVAETFGQYRQVCREAGLEDNMPLTYLTRSVYIAETDEQAFEEANNYLPQAYAWGEHKYDSIPNLGEYKSEGTQEDQRGQAMFTGTKSGVDFWLENDLAYVGSPDTVIQRIKEAHKVTGFDILGARFRFGGMSDEMVQDAIRLFGEKVIPAFAQVPASARQNGS